jgi:hypothetical protein
MSYNAGYMTFKTSIRKPSSIDCTLIRLSSYQHRDGISRAIYETLRSRPVREPDQINKAQLASDRTSCRSPLANQRRLFLHTVAYWLMLTVRDAIPRTHALATAEFATIRLRLLKLSARVIEMASRVRLAFAAACPDATLIPANRGGADADRGVNDGQRRLQQEDIEFLNSVLLACGVPETGASAGSPDCVAAQYNKKASGVAVKAIWSCVRGGEAAARRAPRDATCPTAGWFFTCHGKDRRRLQRGHSGGDRRLAGRQRPAGYRHFERCGRGSLSARTSIGSCAGPAFASIG